VKRSHLRHLLYLLIFLLLLPTQAAATQQLDRDLDQSFVIPAEVLQAMENQGPALRAYQNLWDSFEKDELGNPIYPEEYAGEYINGDKLVIMLVNPTQEQIDEYVRRAQDGKHLVFEKAKYSLNYLNTLNDLAFELLNQGYQISSFGVDRKANSFFISVLPEDYDRLSNELSVSLKHEMGSLPIRIEPGTHNMSTSQLWGGDRIINEDNGSKFSVGIGGKYNGDDAILTAGHGNEKVGIINTRYPYIEFLSRRTGQVVFQRANQSPIETGVNSLGDFAIVKLNGIDTPTNRIYGGVSITGTYSSVPIGTTVYKYGASSGYSWGTVQRVGITVTYSGGLFNTYVVSGLYESFMNNGTNTDAIAPGDSGGPVYIVQGSEYKLHGIVSARAEPTNGPALIMYSTPIYFAENVGFTVKTSN